VAPQRGRYTHLYFYIIDEVLGPFAMRMGAYLPFYATYYLNGHDIIAPMLTAEGVSFRMKDNAFVSVADPSALQAAADRIDPHRIQERLDYWTFMLGPKFAQHERDNMDLRRYYFISQIEHAQNIIFKRNHPIHSIFVVNDNYSFPSATIRIPRLRELPGTFMFYYLPCICFA
jgi:hypothetical protein